VAKVTQSPVFHVNVDDIEALLYVVELAIEFRQKWHRDVFIDLLGYRKHGHNEGDEPRFTQPALYKAIAKHPNSAEIYANKIVAEKSVDMAFIEVEKKKFEGYLEEEYTQSQSNKRVTIRPFFAQLWQKFRFPTPESFEQPVETRFDKHKLADFALKANSFTDSDGLFRKTLKIMQERVELAQNNKADWALAEQLAYATLLAEGFGVRISGQDSVRGTFSHRHAAVLDENSERRIVPLRDKLGFGKFQVYNSLLSEYGVLGFEYGHALASPDTLTIWEAQFGDFVNTAQVIIDQYIVSAGEKWGNMNGLTLFLPHGYEGQGAEHSSARMERFLALAADENMTIANCTTPANLFHLLRRQMKRNFRIPMVLFTPKSLLRHPKVISTLDQLAYGAFEPVIDDAHTEGEITRVVFCTGKVYFELLEEKEKLNATDVALIRIEELYPFPKDHVNALIKKYHSALIWLWVQEEPENMGAWNFIRDQINLPELKVVARRRTATTAVGLQAIHKMEQQEIIQKVFKPCTCERKLKYCGLQCVSGKERLQILKQREYLMQLKDNML
jgi:2-oxoglutarate dehydrogenase E1 component